MKVKGIYALIMLAAVAMIPFQVSAEGARVGGKAYANDVVVSTVGGSLANWHTLVDYEFDIPAYKLGYCVATGSAEALNAGGTYNQYRFTLALDDTSPAVGSACERTIDTVNNSGVVDPVHVVVSTTCPFLNLFPGSHTIRFLATKVSEDDAHMIVNDSSLTIVCTDTQLK